MLNLCFIFWLKAALACELIDSFDMSTLFQKGDVMIGGIFPILNKQISIMPTFERKPLNVKCAG